MMDSDSGDEADVDHDVDNLAHEVHQANARRLAYRAQYYVPAAFAHHESIVYAAAFEASSSSDDEFAIRDMARHYGYEF